jgi:hypothetical protein
MSSHIILRDHIDRLLAEPKELAGATSWNQGPRSGQLKWKAPLLVSGEVLSMDLIVVAYPIRPYPTFMMMLTYHDGVVCRLDYADDDEHNNGFMVPLGIPMGKIRGPHLHSWPDNRELASKASLPDELEFAKIIPSAARGFPNAFRWFCGEHNIHITDVPEYPGSDLLL